MHKLCTLLLAFSLVGQAVGQDVRTRGSRDQAQQSPQPTRTIRGQVVDGDNQPIIGATVQVFDRSGRSVAGAYTDASGAYSLNVPEGEGYTIRFSYVGTTTQTLPLTSETAYNATLKQDLELQEVVVTGFGTQYKRDASGAYTTVSGKQLEGIPTASFDAALQGRAAGAQIVQSNGIPGSAVRIRIRGAGSIGGNSDPLIVIDGVPIISGDASDRNFGENPTTATNTNALANLNPNDIERIDILKDAYAAAIYGSRGANGVVLITTKRGRAGQTTVNLNYYAGYTEATRKLEFLNGQEWLALRGELYANQNGGAQMPSNFNLGRGVTPATASNTDWVDEFLRQGTVQEANVSLRGGSEQSTYYLGVGYLNQDGILANSNLERLSARFNYDFKINDKLKAGTQTQVSRTVNNQPRESYNGGLGQAQLDMLPIWPIRNPDGSYFGSQDANPNAVQGNPVAVRDNASYVTTDYRVLSNLYASYSILPNLEWRSEFGFDYTSTTNLNRANSNIRFVRRAEIVNGAVVNSDPAIWVPSGAFSERRAQTLSWNTRHFATWNGTFGGDHRLRAQAGFEANFTEGPRFTTIYTTGQAGFIDPFYDQWAGGLQNYTTNLPVFVPTMGGYNGGLDERYGFVSFFTRADYTYRDKLTVGLSVRVDGSSRFGDNRRYGTFPAASVGYILTEGVVPKSNLLNYLKVRGSFGLTGNANIANFGWANTFSGTSGYLGIPGTQVTRFPNPDLSWESNYMYNLGVDAGLWNDRISAEIDFWYRRSESLLLEQSVQASTGFTQLRANTDVVVVNRGIDVALKGNILVAADRRSFGWQADVNLSFLQNEVTDAAGLPPDAFPAGPGDARVLKGQPVGVSFLVRHAGIDPATGDELFFDRDGNIFRGPLTSDFVANNRVASGDPFPWLTGGINNTFTWNGFDLNVLLTFQVGNTIYDDGAKFQIGNIAGANQRREILDRWTPTNTDATYPRLGFVQDFGFNNSTLWLYDGDFLRVRTVTLGYTLPSSLTQQVGMSSVRIFVQGQNLFVFTRFPGWDPEVVRYADNGNAAVRTQETNISFAAPYLPTPQARTVTAGVNITF